MAVCPSIRDLGIAALVARGPQLAVDALKEYVRKVRPAPEPVVRFETPPGHQAQVDFAHFRFPWGRRWALLLVLGFSRLLWLWFFERQDMGCVPRFVEKERRPPLRHQGIRSGGNLRVFENLAQTLVAVDAP